MKTLLLALSLALCAGCSAIKNHYVISGTTTVIGVEIAENPQTQLYHARLGYVRAELAMVPTNKGDTNSVAGGAKDTADVIMEIRYGGIFSRSGGIYQRLAVGSTAVSQPGAAFMFAKDSTGDMSPLTADAVSKAIGTVTNSPSASTVSAALPAAKAYEQSNDATKAVFDEVAKTQGYKNFSAFLTDKGLTADKVQLMIAALKLKGLL